MSNVGPTPEEQREAYRECLEQDHESSRFLQTRSSSICECFMVKMKSEMSLKYGYVEPSILVDKLKRGTITARDMLNVCGYWLSWVLRALRWSVKIETNPEFNLDYENCHNHEQIKLFLRQRKREWERAKMMAYRRTKNPNLVFRRYKLPPIPLEQLLLP